MCLHPFSQIKTGPYVSWSCPCTQRIVPDAGICLALVDQFMSYFLCVKACPFCRCYIDITLFTRKRGHGEVSLMSSLTA